MMNYPTLRTPFLLHAIAGLCGWLCCATSTCFAAVANVSIGDDFFSPTSTTINAGDQVQWTWTGSIPHSTTSNTGLWDSGVHAGGSFTFTQTFVSSGNFPYHCTIHSFMVASVTVQSANTPPVVAITSPTNGAVLSAPATFTLTATASDADGTVTNVQFLQGAVSLANVANSPFFLPVSNLVAGVYTLSVIATDNGGLKATNAISISVNALPTVSILAPTNGATFSAPWTGTIQATASDSDGSVSKVAFFAGATLLGTVTNPPLDASLTATNVGAGTYVLTAMATDNQGGSSTSAGITINVLTAAAITLRAEQRLSPTTFQFQYSANAGLSYVVQRSVDLARWQAISTNKASSNLVVFQDANTPANGAYYRVRLQPNP